MSLHILYHYWSLRIVVRATTANLLSRRPSSLTSYLARLAPDRIKSELDTTRSGRPGGNLPSLRCSYSYTPRSILTSHHKPRLLDSTDESGTKLHGNCRNDHEDPVPRPAPGRRGRRSWRRDLKPPVVLKEAGAHRIGPDVQPRSKTLLSLRRWHDEEAICISEPSRSQARPKHAFTGSRPRKSDLDTSMRDHAAPQTMQRRGEVTLAVRCILVHHAM